MKKVYLCAPLSVDVTANLEKIRQYCRYALLCGTAPVVPHFYAECLDDSVPAEREIGRSAVMISMCSMTAFAAGDVAGAIEQTWNTAKAQIQTVVNNVVFPVVDMILAILFFVKVGTSYFEYRKHGQFEFAAPCILFACLIFTLTAPLYIWSIL